ncbi:hypothetical protein GCM10009722_13560 [Williamsia deligens]|nr:multicomponent Na+:H+ antiporter subunit F [Williamsia deligens]
MTVVWVIAATMLLAAAAITMIRILAGPGTLDRLVALDTLIALSMCSLAGWAAYSLDSTVVPAVVALALLSFVGSAAIARFRVRDDVVRVQPPRDEVAYHPGEAETVVGTDVDADQGAAIAADDELDEKDGDS